MNYDEAVEYIHSTYKFGSKLGLMNIRKLLDLLGNPHERLKTIHVAGTNGKGSTCALLHSILMQEGLKVGLFTSPYLERFTERIRINETEIPNDDLARIASLVKEKVEWMLKEGHAHPTEFEIITAIGFYYFYEKKVDIAIIEVGLGGRLDSTNVINPLLSIITSISYDHMDILGDTIEKIAYEKAGIIKEGTRTVLYPQINEVDKVMEDVCRSRGAALDRVADAKIVIQQSTLHEQTFSFQYKHFSFERLKLHMVGRHQIMNAATALLTVLRLREMGFEIGDDSIRKGLEMAVWPGRMELISSQPAIFLDGAHNDQGSDALCAAVDEYLKGKSIILLTGILADKEHGKIVEHFARFPRLVITTTPDSPRALDPYELADEFRKFNIQEVYTEPDIYKAVENALSSAGRDDVIIISGSLYLVGKVRSFLKK